MRRPDQRPEVKQPPRWQFGEPERIWLDNGLKVLVCRRPGQHIVAVALVLDTPLCVEPAEIEGVATITQRCLDEGTATHPGAAFAEALEDIGAALGGSATQAATELFVDVPAPRLPEALELLAEVIREPQLAAADVERHQQLRLAEIEHILSNSAQRAALSFRPACIPSRFRAARMAGGRQETVARITAGDVAEFHQRFYQPEGATLIITGDVDDSVFGLAEQHFGTWAVEQPGEVSHQSPTGREPQFWLIDRPGAVQADVRLGSFGIDRSDPRWADLQVATHALGGAFLSRLNRVLREEKGYTYGVHLTNQAMRDGGLLSVQGSFRTAVTVPAICRARELLDLTEAPISAAEVTDAVNYIVGVSPLRYSTAAEVTGRLATVVSAGLSTDYIDTSINALSQVTPQSATAALSELLPADRLTLVVVGDAEVLEPELIASGWPVVRHH